MHIGLTFPTKGRVEKVERLIASLRGFDPDKHKVTLYLGLSEDDPQYDLYLDLETRYKGDISVKCVTLSKWEGLGEAFNEIIEKSGDEIETYSMFGDDMVFKSSPQIVFDEIEHFFNSECDASKLGVISFNDGFHNKNRPDPIAINGFVHSNWVDCLGMFIPSSFYADYSDNWLADIGKMIGRWKYCPDITIEHLHFVYNKSEMDDRCLEKLKFDQSRSQRSSVIYDRERLKYKDILNIMTRYGVTVK